MAADHFFEQKVENNLFNPGIILNLMKTMNIQSKVFEKDAKENVVQMPQHQSPILYIYNFNMSLTQNRTSHVTLILFISDR